VVDLCWRSCASVIAISGFCARQAVLMGVDPRRVVTVLNAANATPREAPLPPRPLPERPAGAFVSLVPCAALRRHKGVHLAVDAMRHLARNHVLWVTGDPAERSAAPYVAELRAAAAAAGVADRLHFLGMRTDIHRVMKEADVVLVPSTWAEPFGLVAAEAQLLGVPVVASNRGALPEIVTDGDLGLTFDPEDTGSLAAAVARLAGNPRERDRMTDAACRVATARYSYDRWAREVATALRDAARLRRTKA
jgi:glycosyltransferase involved in cell wall biosynthesis